MMQVDILYAKYIEGDISIISNSEHALESKALFCASLVKLYMQQYRLI